MVSAQATILDSGRPGRPPRAERPAARWGPSVRQTRWAMLFALGSGLLLWEALPLPWALTRPLLVAHVLGSIALLGVIVAPFWLRHRTRLRFSSSRPMTWTGRAIELALGALVLSGTYLFLVGNPGAWPGRVAHHVHLWLSVPLWIVLSWHAGSGIRTLASHLVRAARIRRRPRSA